MGSSSSFSKLLRGVLVGVITFQFPIRLTSAEMVRPFPAIGEVHVLEAHWNDVPETVAKLTDQVQEESIRFQLTSSAAEEYFSIGLLDESRRAFQRLLKAKKPSPSLF